MSERLLSVVVPCYNVEKHVENCIRSIMRQSYRNIEIICVDDASPDGSIEILKRLSQEDDRIRIIRYEKNRGLFHARLTGIAAANGEYIAFVDSDDYVSCDWFRPLVQHATETNADITIGNIVEIDENRWMHYSNICRSLPKGMECLKGDDVYRTFMKQRGSLYYWHVMWNKVYKKSFFDSCLPYYDTLEGHLVMTEDIAFSCVLYSYARNVQLVDNDCYFYCRHQEASTSISLPQEKIIKNVKDVIRVFSFFKKVLQERGIYDEVKEDYDAFRSKYFRIWCNSIRETGLDKNKATVELMLNGFEQEKLSFTTPHEFHLNALNTIWDDRFEKLKQEILREDTKIVSFDVFDTLVKRPLWVPDDVKYFIGYEAREILGGYEENSFVKMRTYAEQKCRESARLKDVSNEDVTLVEIYDTMREIYQLCPDVVEALMQKELEMELKLILPRHSGKELFELALSCGKTVVIVSDMYMSEKTVRAILDKCGYGGYEKLYVSSEYRKLKYSGNLFRIVLGEIREKFGVAADNILHIGDTWQNDIVIPRQFGMRASFLPKAIDVFTGNVKDIFNGNCTSFMKENLSDVFDTRKLSGQLPLRTMYAIVANNMFDNPFNSFQAESRFNGDPFFMGYFALGTYLFGIAKWIFNLVRKENYERILFIARDGFIVQKVFDDIVRRTRTVVNSDYVYTTRRSVLPYIMDSKEKFYTSDNFVNIYSLDYTYRKFLQLFTPVTNSLTSELEKEYARHGIILDEVIGSNRKFNRFISVFNELSFNAEKSKAAVEQVKSYFCEKFQGKCAAFDAGYSGRIQKALSELCGHPVDAMFLHDNGHSTQTMAKSGNFTVHNYYGFNPLATDILRETFISENAPSCIGYEATQNGVNPVFEKQTGDYMKNFAIDLMQRAAVKYSSDFLDSFAEYLDFLSLRNEEAGYMFEYFCTKATEFDKYVFINYTIEDRVYSGFDGLSLVYRWNANLQEIAASHGNLQEERIVMPPQVEYSAVTAQQGKTIREVLVGKSRFKKALFYFLFDREMFKYKMRNWCERKKKRK